jgi:hypothetical protein
MILRDRGLTYLNGQKYNLRKAIYSLLIFRVVVTGKEYCIYFRNIDTKNN